jgi:hypothetical protein
MFYSTCIKISINFKVSQLFIFNYRKMLNDKKNRQVILRQNESHLRGGATHNRVILFKMV